jgi:hypothetical protein
MVTERLGVQPSRTLEADAPLSRRSAKLLGSSRWLLNSSTEIEIGTELDEQLRRLLDLLEPVTGKIWELIREGYEADWYCWVASHATEHAAILERSTLQRLLAFPGDLWLDVTGDETDE